MRRRACGARPLCGLAHVRTSRTRVTAAEGAPPRSPAPQPRAPGSAAAGCSGRTSPPAQRPRPARTGPDTGRTPSSCVDECPFLGRLPSVRSRAVLFGALLDSVCDRCGTASQGDVLGSPHWSQIQILDPPPTCGVTWYKLTASVRFRFLT